MITGKKAVVVTLMPEDPSDVVSTDVAPEKGNKSTTLGTNVAPATEFTDKTNSKITSNVSDRVLGEATANITCKDTVMGETTESFSDASTKTIIETTVKAKSDDTGKTLSKTTAKTPSESATETINEAIAKISNLSITEAMNEAKVDTLAKAADGLAIESSSRAKVTGAKSATGAKTTGGLSLKSTIVSPMRLTNKAQSITRTSATSLASSISPHGKGHLEYNPEDFANICNKLFEKEIKRDASKFTINRTAEDAEEPETAPPLERISGPRYKVVDANLYFPELSDLKCRVLKVHLLRTPDDTRYLSYQHLSIVVVIL